MKKLMLGLMMAFAVTAEAEVISDVQIGDLKYSLDTEAKTATITGYEGSPATVDVSEVEWEGQKYIVTSVGERAFLFCSSLVSISLPNATTIEERAFYRCQNLKEVSLPNATTIGKSAFSSCGSLTSVYLPNATTIGDSAFSDCSSLASVSLPLATTILETTFFNCKNLKEVSLPNATMIGNNAFNDCSSLTSVSLPNATTIRAYAFSSCSSLTSVSLPLATTILGGAFGGCSSLTSVSLPNATTIGDWAFLNCGSLTSVFLPNATTIGAEAFLGCENLKEVSLPNATTIGESAFSGCSSLTSVYLPNATTIGESAFEGCLVLSSLVVNAEMKKEIEEKGSGYYGIRTNPTIKVFEPLPEDVVRAAGYGFQLSPIVKSGDTVLDENDYLASCTTLGIPSQKKLNETDFKAVSKDAQVIGSDEIAVKKESIQAAKAETISVADGVVTLNVNVCSNGNFTAETSSWEKAKIADVKLNDDGTVTLTVPVSSASAGFMILQSKDAKVNSVPDKIIEDR